MNCGGFPFLISFFLRMTNSYCSTYAYIHAKAKLKKATTCICNNWMGRISLKSMINRDDLLSVLEMALDEGKTQKQKTKHGEK